MHVLRSDDIRTGNCSQGHALALFVVWPRGVMVRALDSDLRLKSSRILISAVPLSCKLFTSVAVLRWGPGGAQAPLNRG